MDLAAILEKIRILSPEDRDILRRELDEIVAKHNYPASPETAAAIEKERHSSNDERGVPIEDVMDKPEPK